MQVGATSVDVTEGLTQDLIDLAAGDSIDDNNDDGLSGGIVALIVILLLLAVSVPAAIIIIYLVYRKKRQGQFDIFQASVRHRSYGTQPDYIADNTEVNRLYVSKTELRSSQMQERVSSETEAVTERLFTDKSDSNKPENIMNPNFDGDADKDTRL